MEFAPRIAVVGCGAVGSYYGARLARLGLEVHFLLRSDFESVRSHGVRIKTTEEEFVVRPQAANSPGDIGPVDLVLIGLKTTANTHFKELLTPLVGPHTAIVTLQNGLGNEEHLAELFSPAQVLGGLCFVCLNRIAPGIIHHLAHGLIMLGEFQRPANERTHRIADLFRGAAIPCRVTDDLFKAHWEKLVWNIPFNGLGAAGSAGYESVVSGNVAPGAVPGRCLPTDILLGDRRWEELVRKLMLEVISSARALGAHLEDSVAQAQIDRTRSMGSYWASTLIDFERGQELELQSLFLEPLRLAEGAGSSVPTLRAMCSVLVQLGRLRKG